MARQSDCRLTQCVPAPHCQLAAEDKFVVRHVQPVMFSQFGSEPASVRYRVQVTYTLENTEPVGAHIENR